MGVKRSQVEVLADVIREHYDLGEMNLPKSMEEAHQRRHRKLIIDTEQGRFLIKTYKSDLETLDTLRFHHRLSEHLLKNKLPVARIQQTRVGRKIVEQGTWALELQEFVEGHPMQVTSKTLARAGDALGRFHEVCRDFPCPDRETRKWRFSEVPRETFGKLYQRAKSETESLMVDDHCNQIALFLRDAGVALDPESSNQFETGLIHGDWHSGNLLFRGEQLVAIVDLEFSGEGCYLEDLAYAVSNLCVRTATDTDRLNKRTDLMLHYYQHHRTLSPIEERALYFAVGIKHIATVSYQSVQQDGTVAGKSAAEWMEILAAQCEWLRERALEHHG